ncbi:hypothetical protein CAEBREN_05845 [Caenorhabditis brenneri]|uniref:Serpentine Receptor, class Z n=1 Tax=Caenorhabditis brenneri TaxID=135651 RepID=G0N1D7_CAEBE|nr:hypothetical protein CAEBREN_05845 [Caenorhabditis brenneri]
METLLFKCFSCVTPEMVEPPSEFLHPGHTFFIIVFLLIFLLSVPISLCVFPLYIHVYRTNQSRDEEIPIYPFVKHMSKMVTICCFAFLVFLMSILCLGYLEKCCPVSRNENITKPHPNIPMLFVRIFSTIPLFMLLVLPKVFHLIITLLAISRFCLYFFPATEKFVNGFQKFFIKWIWLVYFVNGVKELVNVLFISNYVLGGSWINGVSKSLILEIEEMDNMIQNIILLLSSFLYIPILINLRKYKHLPIAKQSNPQIYIMLQTLFVVVLRIPTLGFYAYSMIDAKPDTHIVGIIIVRASDIFVLPSIIQLSYLFCNKRNLETVFSKVKLKVKQFSGLLFRNRVQPTEAVLNIYQQQGLETTAN